MPSDDRSDQPSQRDSLSEAHHQKVDEVYVHVDGGPSTELLPLTPEAFFSRMMNRPDIREILRRLGDE